MVHPRILTRAAFFLACPALVAVAASREAPRGPAEIIQERFASAQKAQQQGERILAESDYRECAGLSLQQLGTIYHTLGELDRAEAAYRSAIRSLADSDNALLGLAVIYLRKGEFEKGIESVRTLLAQKPFHPGARHLLGKLYFSMNRFDAAARELEEAARMAPGDINTVYTLGLTYLKQKQVEKTRQIFGRVLAELGESPQIHILFGAAYRETDFLDDAVREFTRALELDPTHRMVHYYLGLTYLSLVGRAKTAEAEAEFKAEMALYPEEYLPNYLLGLLYVHDRRLEESLPYLEKAARLDPNKPDPLLYLGQAYFLLGQRGKAVPILEKAIELTKDPSRNEYEIANAHYFLGQALRGEGKIEAAKRQFDLAAQYKEKASVEQQQRLQFYLHSGDVESEKVSGSVTSLEGKAIIVAPEPPPPAEQERLRKAESFYLEAAGKAYNGLGLLRAQESDFMGAARDFREAAQWKPDIPDLDFNLGLAAFRAQDYHAAIGPLERVKSRDPNRREVRPLLGLSYFFVEDYRRAAEELSPLAQSGIQDPQVLYALGLSLVHAGSQPEGEEILRNLLRKYPDAADVHMALGKALALEGRFPEAGSEFSKALELNASVPDGHYFKGLALLRQAKFQEAADQFSQEIARNPHAAKAQYHLGLALISQDQLDEGLAKFQEAVRLDPSYAEAYYEIGKVSLKQGKAGDSVKYFEKAGQLAPDKSYIQYQLSQAYLKTDRKEDAQAALERYRDLKARERASAPGAPHGSEEVSKP